MKIVRSESDLGGYNKRTAVLACRDLKKDSLQRFWKPNLDPPAALGNVAVVLVSPEKPPNVGAVARACNCFEVEDLRNVGHSCPITVKSALNSAMGGQRLLWQAAEFSSVQEAVQGCAYSVAFTRWQEGKPLSNVSVKTANAKRHASGLRAALVEGKLLKGSRT